MAHFWGLIDPGSAWPLSPRLNVKREAEGRTCFSYSLTPVGGVPEHTPVSCGIWVSLGCANTSVKNPSETAGKKRLCFPFACLVR